jgi:hypothetical protein
LGVLGIKQASRKGDEKEKKEAYHILWTPDNAFSPSTLYTLLFVQKMAMKK